MIFRIHRAHSILEAPKARYEKTMQTHKIIYIIIMHVYLIYVHLYSIHVYICIQLRNARKIQMVPCLGLFLVYHQKSTAFHSIFPKVKVTATTLLLQCSTEQTRPQKPPENGLPGCQKKTKKNKMFRHFRHRFIKVLAKR